MPCVVMIGLVVSTMTQINRTTPSKGSAEALHVDLGYYTLNRFGEEEGIETQRTSQVICP